MLSKEADEASEKAEHLHSFAHIELELELQYILLSIKTPTKELNNYK